MKKNCMLLVVAYGYWLTAISQNVGIGTANPLNRLHVAGGLRLDTLTGVGGKGIVTHNENGVMYGIRLTGNTADVLRGNGTFGPADNTGGGGGSTNGTVGFGTWGDCSMNNISEYNPVALTNGNAFDRFGSSVSISGTYAIIGAIGEDVNANQNQGAAYLYFFDGTNWTQSQRIVAPDGAANDFFGNSVAISGNYLIVGAVGANIGSNNDQGAAYIFHFDGNTWTQQKKLFDPAGAAGDQFGTSVSISENNAIVGAVFNTIGSNTFQGSAFCYHYNGSDWIGQKISASDGVAGARFGQSVSVSGDYAVVGAYWDNIGSNSLQGSVYVFHFNGSVWSQEKKIIASDGLSGDELGSSVSISGTTILAGAPDKKIGNNIFQGEVYVFKKIGGNVNDWVQQQTLIIDNGLTADLFGSNVSISGNYALIGAPRGANGNTSPGSCYIFQNIGALWIQLQKVNRPGETINEVFGISCSLNGNRFLIGATGFADSKGMCFFGKIN